MKILVHCNGGGEIGVGHVMRSIAIAEEAISRGHQVTFVGRFESGFVRESIESAGVGWVDSGFVQLREIMLDSNPDVLHIDAYGALPFELSEIDCRTSNMEDGTFGRRSAQMVVDPNLGAEDIAHERAVAPGVLLRGTNYAPVRRSIVRRRREWAHRSDASRVLVVMGGSDPQDLTPLVVDALVRTEIPLEILAISAKSRERSRVLGSHVTYMRPVSDLAGLLVTQDLVVSAAGTSVWELCCLGMPMVLVAAVQNQAESYQRMLASGGAIGLGNIDALDLSATTIALREILTDNELRASLAHRAGELVDGLGASRIVSEWEQLVRNDRTHPTRTPTLSMRIATLDDAEILFSWRTDAGTQEHSRDRAVMTFESHIEWLHRSFDDVDRTILIASDAGRDIGTIRWDGLGKGNWEVSITVAPEQRGRGRAQALLAAGEHYICDAKGEVMAVATVHEANKASMALFEHAGYQSLDWSGEDSFALLAKKLRNSVVRN